MDQDKLEKIVTRLMRRSHKVAKALITPYPISNAAFGDEVKGNILRYMFPCAGVITKGIVDIETKLNAGATLAVELRDSVHSESKTYTMTNRTFLAEPRLEVDAGDKLIVSVYPNDQEEVIQAAWVSFLWTPSIKEVDVRSCLIEELEGNMRNVLEETN